MARKKIAQNICSASVSFLYNNRIAVHPAARGAPSPPDPHAGAEGPGHVCPHPHQHAVPHQEGGKWHRGEHYCGIQASILKK